MIQLLAVPVFGFLDRLGGGGFGFLGAKGWLAEGHKWARRFCIPALVLFLNQSLEQAILCGLMVLILSTNLDEIAEKKWDTVFLYGFSLGAVLYPTAGIWSLLVPAWWFIGVWFSNVGLFGKKVGWHWVELIRGLAIGLAVVLG